MTYIPADPILNGSTIRDARRSRLAEHPTNLPSGTIFLESGRVALWGALRALGLGAGDRLVVPAYICDSILPALAALEVEPRFVATDWRLRPDLAGLERELAAGARAMLVVHYFGFPAPSLGEVTQLCAEYGAGLIEDCAHALFSRNRDEPLGRRGAAAIFSPWKSLPLPDGGALVLNGRVAPKDLAELPRPRRRVTARRLAYRAISVVETALGRSPRLWLLRSRALRRTMQARVAEAALVPRRSSSLAEAIVRGTAAGRVVARRRAHYERVGRAVQAAGWAEPLYPELAEGVCPLSFPILADDRDRRRRELLAAGVNVRAYWEQLPSGVSVDAFAEAHAVADRILVLPVHQSLTPRQLELLTDIIRRLGAS